MRATLLGLAATLLAAPASGAAQMPRASGPPADLRTVRIVPPDVRRAVPHPPVRARPRAPAVLVVGPSWTTWTTWTDVAASPRESPIATPRVPRTRVIDVGDATPADTACGWATHARALMDCAADALRREDERLAAATARARETLLRTRPATTVAAFDAAVDVWAQYRDRECRARTLSLGAAERSYQALACQLRLARERRAWLDPDG